MATKAAIISLPIMPFNKTKHSKVVQYLENIEDFLFKLHSPDDKLPIPHENDDSCSDETISPEQKDEILNHVKVLLCGDLLGRKRITGAKKTRLDCDWNHDKFNNIIEYPALWHAKQSFLGG